MFHDGMTSKGKGSVDKHIVACSRTGLDRQVIIDWIGNRNKVEQGRTYEKAKPVHSRGITSYNCFVQENKEKLGKMENWSTSWNRLSLDDKKDYQEKAKEMNSEPSEPLSHSKHLLKKICSLIKELAETGVEACVVGVDLNQNIIEMGTPKMCSFLKDNPDLVQKVYLHITNGNQKTDGTGRLQDISELRKKAQDQMNMMFSKAVQKESKFPYKKVQAGKIAVSGIPAELLPIQRMSSYGRDKLKTVISLTDISVETQTPSSSENQTDNSTFQESDIITLTQEEYISLQNQDDIGVVELPNDFDLLTELIIPTDTVTTTEPEFSLTNPSDILTTLNNTPTPISTDTPLIAQLRQTQKIKQAVTNKKPLLSPTCTSTSTKPSGILKTTNHTPNLISTDTPSTAQPRQTQKTIQSVTNTKLTLAPTSTSTKPSDTLTTIIHTPTQITTDTPSTKKSIHTPVITAQPTQTQTTVHTHTTTNPTPTSTSSKPSDTLKPTNHTHNLISTDTPSTAQPRQTQKTIQSVTNTKLTLAPTSTSTKPSDTLTTIIHTPTQITTDTPSTKKSIHTPVITAQPTQTQTTVHTHTTTNPTPTSTSTKPSDTLTTIIHTPNLISTDTPSTAQPRQTQKTIETTQTGTTSKATHTKKRKESKDSEGSFKKTKIVEDLNANFFRVAGILKEKKVGRKQLYLVHWDGYPVSQATWEPKGNIPSSILSCYNKKM